MLDLYNKRGRATCFLVDGEWIYLWNGKPVGWIADGKVYSYRGTLLGWFENGWLYDRKNRPCFFCSDATGGPVRPARAARPARGARGARPARGARQATPARPARSLSWSSSEGDEYFGQG